MGNTTLKETEGFQITSLHKSHASLFPYHFFILTARKSLWFPLEKLSFLYFIYLFLKQLLSGLFASCHSCNICSCPCILSRGCRDESCEADLLPPHPSHFPPQWPSQGARILDGSKQHSGHLHSTLLI